MHKQKTPPDEGGAEVWGVVEGIADISLVAGFRRKSRAKMTISHSELLSLLHYDPETGVWLHLLGNNKKLAGERADGRKKIKNRVYRSINLLGRDYLAHRLAWFFVTGEWPDKIDHKDRDGENNRWNNLRPCSQKQNCYNTGISIRNNSGLKGVFWSKEKKKWCAQIKSKYSRHLGYFSCPAAAHLRYIVEADILFGEFACAG